LGRIYNSESRISTSPKDTVRSVLPLIGDKWLDKIKLTIAGKTSSPPIEFTEYFYRKEMHISYEEMMNTPAEVVYADLAILSEDKRQEALHQKRAYEEMKREKSKAKGRRR